MSKQSEDKMNHHHADLPVLGKWTKVARYLPWTDDPWENDEWKVVRHTRTAVMWHNFETGAEVHASKHIEPDRPGWKVVATPDDDAPVGETFYPYLSPRPTDKKTALYIAEQYMKHGVGLVTDDNVVSLNPPRLKPVEDRGNE